MVDGGKGQLNIAVSVVKNLDLPDEFEIIGIAKRDEKKGEVHDKIFKPGRVNPISFGREGDLLLYLQRIRDEAHRFAIAFHRKRRQKSSLQSMLDTIPGIGKKRKATLFRNFKSLKAIRAASLEELSTLPGIGQKLAEQILRTLSG
jgi:excinuclease ABC subunit C